MRTGLGQLLVLWKSFSPLRKVAALLLLATLFCSGFMAFFFLLTGPDFGQSLRWSFLERFQLQPDVGHRWIWACLVCLIALIAVLTGGIRAAFRWLERTRSGLPLALVIAASLLAIYLYHGRCTETADNLTSRYLGVALVSGHGFDLGQIPRIRDDHRPYYAMQVGKRWISATPILRDLMALPLFFPTWALNSDLSASLLAWMELRIGALLCAIAGGVVFFALRCRWSLGISFWATVTLFLGTCIWSAGAHSLWMQAPMIFFSAWGLLFWLKGLKQPRNFTWAALAFGFGVMTRPTGILGLGVFLLYLACNHRRSLIKALPVGMLPVIAVLVFNLALTGYLLGGYTANFSTGRLSGYQAPFFLTLGAHLISPSRGLFAISPMLLLILLGLFQRQQSVARWMALPSLLLLIQASFYSRWWGGASIGYRILLDFFPLLAVALAGAYEFARKRFSLTLIACLLLLCSVFVQSQLQRPGVITWNRGIENNPSKVWSLRGAQWLYPWRQKLWHRIDIRLISPPGLNAGPKTQLKLFHEGICWYQANAGKKGKVRLFSPYSNQNSLVIKPENRTIQPTKILLEKHQDTPVIIHLEPHSLSSPRSTSEHPQS